MTLFLRKSPTASSKNIENAHIDSRSPGYVARVIRYNEEHEHLPIYEYKENHKLSSFSVGQAAKNDLSLHLKRISSTNSQTNSPKLPKFASSDHNRILLESIIQASPEKKGDSYEVNTKNVLEALKEISRKRIHSPEQEKIVLKDDRKNPEIWSNDINIRKKMKFNHLQPKSIVSKEYNTTSCLDELKASHTSMDRHLVVAEQPKKEHWTESIKQSPSAKESTHAKRVDVETQTIPVAQPTNKQEKPNNEPKEVPQQKLMTTSTASTKSVHRIKKTSPIKIFDETPLEKMRKNRLSVLMGSFTEKKTDQHKKPEDDATSEAPDKPLISILTKSVKDSAKTSKHVTFNIPTAESTNSVNTSTSSPFSMTFFKDVNTVKTNNEKDMITKTSMALVTPIVSSSVVETSPLKNIQTKQDGNNNQFSAQSSGQNRLNLSTAQTVSSSNSLSFSITTSAQSPPQNFLGKLDGNFAAVPTSTKSFFTSLTNPVTSSTSSGSAPSNFVNQNATVEPFRLPSTTVNPVTQNSLSSFNPPTCNSSTNITNKIQVYNFGASNLTIPFAQNPASTIKPSFSSLSTTPALNTPSSKSTETKSFSSNLTFATPPSINNIHKTAPFGQTTSSAFNTNDASSGLSTFTRPQFSITAAPVSVSTTPGTINTTVTTSNNLFMNTNSFAQSPPAFSGFFDKTQGSGFNTSSSAPPFNSSFGQPTTTSGLTSNTGSNQSNNNPLFPPFSTGNSSTGGGGFKLNSFQNTNNTGSGPFTSGLPTSPPNVFTFGASNKSTFSFGSTESPKQSFNFNSSGASTPAFDTTNRNVGLTFNSPGTGQFNIQPPAPSIFNIGSGTSMPTRPRSQLKAKRRT